MGAVLAVILAMAIVWLWRLNEQAYQEFIVQKVVAEREEAESQLVNARAESERLKMLNAEADKNLSECQRRVSTLDAAIMRAKDELSMANEKLEISEELMKKAAEEVRKRVEEARRAEEEARKIAEEARKAAEEETKELERRRRVLGRLLDSKSAIKAPEPSRPQGDNSQQQVQKPGSNPDRSQEQLQR